MAFLMQHFTLELLRKGVIDRNDKPDLYREALMEREKLLPPCGPVLLRVRRAFHDLQPPSAPSVDGRRSLLGLE